MKIIQPAQLKHFAVLALIAVLFSGCKKAEEKSPVTQKTDEAVANNAAPDAGVAVGFINDYIENAGKMNEAVGIVEWVSARNDVTENFKNEVKRIVDEANAADPEMGLDADPVIDAQDYDSSGMETDSVDNSTGYIIVRGKP